MMFDPDAAIQDKFKMRKLMCSRECGIHNGVKLHHFTVPRNDIFEHMRLVNKFYECKKCYEGQSFSSGHYAYGLHVRCLICGMMFSITYGLINDISNHNTRHADLTNLCNIGAATRLGFAGLLNTMRSNPMALYSALDSICPIFPQLTVLSTAPETNPEINELIVYAGLREYSKFGSFDGLVAELKNLIEDFIMRKTFACVFCGDDYDTLPTAKLARLHIKNCVALREAR